MQTPSPYVAADRGPTEHEVRSQIVTAATEHFRRYGYEKTTVSEVAKAIGFSKAYVYRFFASKQAIGELICANCLQEIVNDVRNAIGQNQQPPEKLRRMFKTVVESCKRLFFQERKLYDIAAVAATQRWQATLAYEASIQAILHEILLEGRQSGDFERKTPIDETTRAISLVIRPYMDPLLLQYSFDSADEAPGQLASLVLRSLSP